MRQNAGLDFTRDWARFKSNGACLSGADGAGVTNQRRAIRAAEAERIVRLNQIACWASFHMLMNTRREQDDDG